MKLVHDPKIRRRLYTCNTREEDALAEDNGDKDDTNRQGNTNEESGDNGDDAYADDNAEKERESWTDLDDEVSAVDIIIPQSLICSSLLDCSG